MSDETLPSVSEETPLALDETALPSGSDYGRRIAAAKLTDTLPASAYIGAATLEINRDQEAILDEPVPDNEIDIRPDGLIYVSHEYVRRQLNRAFGRLQWALVPGSPLVAEGNDLYQRWVLLVQGTYVSEAFASRRYFQNGNQTRDDVAEAIKSDCIRRCAKDLGIGLQAWNRRFGEQWRKQYAIQVLRTTSQGNKKEWRRIDGDPLSGEIQAKPTEVVGENKEALPPIANPTAAPTKVSAAPPPPSTPPPTPQTQKPGPRAVPKPAASARTAGTTVMAPTESQLRLLWVRAMGAQLVVGDDAEKWIEFLNENCMVEIPDRSGKKSKEIAATMMRMLPAGAQFQKLLKTLEIQAQSIEVEI